MVLDKELNQIRNNHQTATDNAIIDEYFHSHSHMQSEDDETRFLDKDQVQAAEEELMNRWDFTATPEQQTLFQQTHFNPTWDKFNTDGVMNLELAQDFVDSLLSPTTEAQSLMDQESQPSDAVLY